MSEHKSLAAALAAFQAELPQLGKDSTANAGTYTYDYADLASVSRAVLPLLGKHGLSFSTKPTLVDGKFCLVYTLRHALGDSEEGIYPLPAQGQPQQIGSAITYARRYALMAVTGVFPGGEDDDGKSAGEIRERWQEPALPSEEQAFHFGELLSVIDAAADEAELVSTGPAVKAAHADHSITPFQYEKLAKRVAERLAEMRTREPAGDSAGDPVAGQPEQPGEARGGDAAQPARQRRAG